jgi:hypothetical protein
MRFLYCRASIPLEDLCGKWHLVVWPRGFPNLIRINASVASGSLLHAGQRAPEGASKMLDIVMLAIGLGFFALSVGYAMACDQL